MTIATGTAHSIWSAGGAAARAGHRSAVCARRGVQRQGRARERSLSLRPVRGARVGTPRPDTRRDTRPRAITSDFG